LLASVAAFITSVGLRAPSNPIGTVGVSSAPTGGSVPPSDAPGSARPSGPAAAALTDIVSPQLWRSAASAEHAARAIEVAAPTGSPTADSAAVPVSAAATPSGASGGSGGSSGPAAGSGDGTAAARPTATPAVEPTPGHGKGHGKGRGHAPSDGPTTPGKGRGR
jgi:hypothetical protein